MSSKAVHQDQLDRDVCLNGDERIDSLNSEASAIIRYTTIFVLRQRFPEGMNEFS